MSRHNYSQYSSNKNDTNTSPINASKIFATATSVAAVADEPAVAPEIKMVVETVDTVSLPETVTGVVANCKKLNVRAEPSTDAAIVCVLDAMSEMEIDTSKSTDEWVNVCTAAGVKGYCMRKFVDVSL